VTAPISKNDPERLRALRETGILDTDSESAYDQLTELAAKICEAPIAIIGLVDSDRLWLKSKVGLAFDEIPREDWLCSDAVFECDLLIVPDTTSDERFANNPYVLNDPHIRFYAGAPLITSEGHAVGALCVLDHVPRQLNEYQRKALRFLSAQVLALIELHKTRSDLERAESRAVSVVEALRASEELKSRLIACSHDCIHVLDLEGQVIFMNEGGIQALEICDFEAIVTQPWVEFWEGEDRIAARKAVEAAQRGDISRFTGYLESRIHHEPKWWNVVVSSIGDKDGKPERLLAVLRDVTAEKLSELARRDSIQVNRAIIQDAGEGIVVYDRDLRYKVFNPFMERLTGKPAQEVLGKVATQVFPRLATSGLEESIKRALHGEVVKVADVLVPAHSADGHDVWESATFAPHYDGEGNIVGAIGLIFDVTDRHLLEETFRAIVVGTASATGKEFFPSLVKHMAAALHVRWAMITECSDGENAKALAYWKGDRFADLEFNVAGTPCERVIRGEVCHYAERLAALFPSDAALEEMGAESYLGVPMFDEGTQVLGHIALFDDKPMPRNERAVDLVRIFASRAAAELKRQRTQTKLQAALAEVQALQQRLEAENVYLQEEIRKEHNFDEIVGNSPALLEVLRQVETVAPTDSTVLILGETGCGKELIARAIHNRSKRKSRPLVKVNCGAIPTGLVESELFGHMKGAFTGALERRTGRFELADGGTLFLDEITELPLETQVKLLRVLQEQEFEPLGSSRTVRVNVRIIAASNREVEKAVQEGQFRTDLFYRLNVLPITLPPLRERRSDVPLLTAFFVDRFARQLGKQIKGISQDTMDVLSGYAWPGNIRELQNVIERAVVLCQGGVLRMGSDLLPVRRERHEDDAKVPLYGQEAAGGSLEDVERAHIIQVLNETRWVIEGPRGAAKILKLHPNTLRSRMKKLGVERYSATRA